MVVSNNGSAVQRSASAVVGLQTNESFTYKLPNAIILITVHSGTEARRKLKVESTNNRNLCEKLNKFFGELEKIMTDAEQQNNQQETGTKLL